MWVAAGLELFQGMISIWRLTDLVDAEAEHFEAVLQAELTEACDTARRRAVSEELDDYAAQLAIARQALAELEDSLDPAWVTDLRADCDAVEAWLRRQSR